MSEDRIDRLTRRAAALGLGGVAFGLLGGSVGIGAKKKGKGKKKKKGKPVRCSRVAQVCTSRIPCCGGLFCLPSDPDPDRCCRQLNQPCQAASECCTNLCENSLCACRPLGFSTSEAIQCCSGRAEFQLGFFVCVA